MGAVFDKGSPLCWSWAEFEDDEPDDDCLFGDYCCFAGEPHDGSECHSHAIIDGELIPKRAFDGH